MTQLMEKAFQEVSQLPEEDQKAIASIILQEIESERRWGELFAHPKSADLLSRMADEALADARAGRAKAGEPDPGAELHSRPIGTGSAAVMPSGSSLRIGPTSAPAVAGAAPCSRR